MQKSINATQTFIAVTTDSRRQKPSNLWTCDSGHYWCNGWSLWCINRPEKVQLPQVSNTTETWLFSYIWHNWPRSFWGLGSCEPYHPSAPYNISLNERLALISFSCETKDFSQQHVSCSVFHVFMKVLFSHSFLLQKRKRCRCSQCPSVCVWLPSTFFLLLQVKVLINWKVWAHINNSSLWM